MENQWTGSTAPPAPTPVELSNQSAALPGTANPITNGPMASPGTLNMLTGGNPGGGSGIMSPAGGAATPPVSSPAATPAATPVAAAPPPAAVTPTLPAAEPEAEPLPSYVPFLSQRSVGYGWSAPVSAGVERGATNFNPLFGTRLAKAIADGETVTGERAVFNDMERAGTTQAQYYADYIGRPISYQGQTLQPDPSRLGRMAARPPGLGGAPGSRHQLREDAPMGEGVEAVDFSKVSPAVRDYVKENAGRYGLQNVPGDLPHIQLNRKIALTDDEANDVIAKLGFPSVEAFQQASGAEVDGIIGPETRGKVLAAMAGDGAPPQTMVAGAEAPPQAMAFAGGDTLTDADRAIEAVANAAATPAIGNIDPANWQDTRDAIWSGNVPWGDLPPDWRDELTAKFGKDAPRQYDIARDRLAAQDRAYTVQGATKELPEMWGEAPDDAPAKAAPSTKAAGEAPKPSAEAPRTPVLARGAKGPDVASYQMMLAGMGFYQAGIDQDYGRRTENAVKAFQAEHGLKADGKIGPMTGPAIEAAFARKIENPRAPVRGPQPLVPVRPVPADTSVPWQKRQFREDGTVRPGPVQPRTALETADMRRGTIATRMANAGELGNDLTQMSIDRTLQGGNALTGPMADRDIPGSTPRMSSALQRGGAGPGGVETATMEQRREAAKETVRAEVAAQEAENARIDKLGTVPATDRPLTTRFERMDPEAQIEDVQRVIDTHQGVPEDAAVFGTDPMFDNIKGGSGADRLRQRWQEIESDDSAAPPPAPVGGAPTTAMGRDVVRNEDADTSALDVATGLGAGTLRGVEDVVGTVANAIGWSVSGAASLMAREGIITQNAADAVAANEARRKEFASEGPATAAIAGEDAENLPGYGVGRIAGQVLGTAAPVAGSFNALRVLGPLAGDVGAGVANFLTGTGGAVSKGVGGALAGAEGAALSGQDAVAGAAGGALGGLGVAVGGPAARWVADKFRNLPAPREAITGIRNIVQEAGVNIDDAIAKLKADPSMRLFQLNPALADEARSLAQTGGNKASSVLKQAVEADDAGAGELLLTKLDQRLGRVLGEEETLKNINDAIKRKVNPLYEGAKDAEGVLMVQPVVSMIDKKMGEAKGRALQNALKDFRGYLFDRNGNIETDVAPLLKARQAMDDFIDKNPKALTETSAGRNAMRDLTEVRTALDSYLKTVPGIRSADSIYASGQKVKDAFAAGQQFMSKSYEDVSGLLKHMTPGERVAYREGARRSVDGYVRSNPVAKGNAIVRNAESEKKFSRVFGDDGIAALDDMASEFAKKASGNKVARGSDSAGSLARSGAFSKVGSALTKASELMTGGGVGYALTGDPLHIITGMGVAGMAQRGMSAMAAKAERLARESMAEAMALKGDEAISFLQAVRSINTVRPGNKFVSPVGAASGGGVNERRRAVANRPGNALTAPTGN